MMAWASAPLREAWVTNPARRKCPPLRDQSRVVARAFGAASDGLLDGGTGKVRGAEVAVFGNGPEQRCPRRGAGHSPAAQMIVERVPVAEQPDDGRGPTGGEGCHNLHPPHIRAGRARGVRFGRRKSSKDAATFLIGLGPTEASVHPSSRCRLTSRHSRSANSERRNAPANPRSSNALSRRSYTSSAHPSHWPRAVSTR